MPLTLECIGCAAGGIKICQLTGLKLAMKDSFMYQGIGAITQTWLSCPGQADITVSCAGGTVDDTGMQTASREVVLLVGPYLANWGSLALWGSMESSAFQPPGDGHYGSHTGTGSILQTYECLNSLTGESTVEYVTAIPYSFSSDFCFDSIYRSNCVGASGKIYTSSPLGSCNGCAASEIDWLPVPQAQKIDILGSDMASLCLCASGGTPPYAYFIVSGSLPSGVYLNATTGCLEGGAETGVLGSGEVTFRVIDSDGDTAEVTCGFATPPCTDVPDEPVGNDLFSAG